MVFLAPDRHVLRAWLKMHDLTAAGVLVAVSIVLEVGFSGVLIHEFIIPLWSSVSVPLLTPVLSGVGVAVAVASKRQWLDIFHVTLSTVARLLWILLVTGIVSASVALPMLASGSPDAVWAVIRNCLLFTALALIGTAIASSTWAWMMPASYTLLSLVFGQNPAGAGGFQWWAVALHETAKIHSTILVVCLYLFTVVLLLAKDARRI
ncbi:hypothetical protein [Salinispora arenicola]|uniref:hypothetical protein n=1 Tax=Salinispora arenicola TaxID=168697 RepID=UPI0012BC2423|nr:hypothetical protein [Salinispora arenicola]